MDIEQGLAPKSRYWAVGNKDEMTLSKSALKSTNFDEYSQYRQCVYETTTELVEELKTVRIIYDDISEKTRTAFEDLRKAIKATLDSIIRNSSAFLLLMQIKKIHEA